MAMEFDANGFHSDMRGFRRKFPIPNDIKYREREHDPKGPYIPKWRISVASKIVAQDGTGDFETIEDALNDLPTEGGRIFIKAGTYTPANPPLVIPSNVRIEGEGHETEIKLKAGANTNLITMTSASFSSIENLYLNGNYLNQSVPASLVVLTTCANILFYNMNISYAYGTGLYIDDSTSILFLASGVSYSVLNGITINASNAVFLTSSKVYLSGVNGIGIIGSYGCSISQTISTHNLGIGFALSGTSFRNSISQCGTSNNVTGSIVEASVADAYNIYIGNQLLDFNPVILGLDSEFGHNIGV